MPSFLSRKLAVGKAEPYDLKAKRSFAGKRPGKQRPLAAPFPACPLREQAALPNQRYNRPKKARTSRAFCFSPSLPEDFRV